MWQPMKDTGKAFAHPELGKFRLWMNDKYAAGLRVISPGSVHLNIVNIDGTDRHNWRDFQRIKNDICGDDAEAVEIYPAERRLVDTANNFHLWVFADPLPFGFNNRAIAEGVQFIPDSPQFQTPFEQRPQDCIDVSGCASLAEAMQMLPSMI